MERGPTAALLAAACRRLEPRLPNWLQPNHVTFVSVGATLTAGAFFYLAGRQPAWFAAALLALYVHWVCDELDGALARARHLASERGFFLDMFLDAYGYTAVFLGIAFASYTSFVLPACSLVVVHLRGMIMLHRILLRREFVIPFPGPSELPVAMTILSLLTVFLPRRLFMLGALPVGWFDAAALTLSLTGLAQLVFETVRLARSLDGPPQPAR